MRKVDSLFFLADVADQAMVQAILHTANKQDIFVMLGTLNIRLSHAYKYFKVFKFFVINGSYSAILEAKLIYNKFHFDDRYQRNKKRNRLKVHQHVQQNLPRTQ